MLCAVVKGPSIKEAREQLTQIQEQCSLAELRLDYFNDYTLDDLKDLQKDFSLPLILTLRSKSQGGLYDGIDEERLLQIEKLASLKPAYIDVEYNSSKAFVSKLKTDYPETKIILSYHDFHGMPNLESILAQMKQCPADIYKMAVMLNSSCEALRLLQFMKEHQNVLAMGMGEYGKVTRVLSPIFGGAFVYCSIDDTLITAPGQLTAHELLNIYHYKTLNPSTKIFGLIGNPIDSSLGHIVHNAIIPGVYVKMPVHGDQLAEFMHWSRKIGLCGLSVTMPLKEDILQYLDEIDSWAKGIQAVNTVVFKDGTLKGYNTDGKGALDAIENKIIVKDKTLLMIGAGGSAKSIAAEAKARGARVIVLNRDVKRAEALAKMVGCEGGNLEDIEKYYKNGYDILINVTPVSFPIEAKWILSGTVVMDIQFQPKFTPLLIEARKKGCILVHGYEMWINQALAQQKLWFDNVKNPLQIKALMEKIILEHIRES